MKNRKLCYVILGIVIVFVALFLHTLSENREATETLSRSLDNSIVIIDAGHGGIDGGAVGIDGTVEKDINLSVALKLDELLRASGINTRMTRTEDISIHDESAKTVRQKKVSDIHNRFGIMEETENSIFVSIHQNHFDKPKYHGTQVFYSGNNPDSLELANCVQSAVVRTIQPENSRVVKKSGTEIYLLYHAMRPAIMVECGFLSNPEEVGLLKTSEYQSKLALAIYDGILNYLGTSEEV